ncbi:FAD-dependent oxidoreductase [uncultured Imperialibacter sp.]|uniref:FAD-dependent oxidoreductase n=1 Tax=uncultured Imperialibacter sp. TaxID=1672639 RepID=UPI0030D7C006|tara:strand:- start:46218 stop:47906 length:1689 start_codon:yes stop_codon:yes gene_type:complete
MKKTRIIIVGGLSAGPSAAAKARRTDENAEIIMFEKTSHVSYATCGIPYALSGKIKTRDKLIVVQPELLEKRFGVELHLDEPVTDIDPEARIVYTDKGVYEYDKLVFATGGQAVLPPIKNIEHFKDWAHAKTLEDFDRVMKSGVMERADHFTILGAGLIGLETAENLVHAGKKVTVIELGDQVLANWDVKFAHLAKNVLEDHGIDVRLGVSVVEVDHTTNELILSNGKRLYTDYLLIGISIKPNTQMLVRKGARHLPNGALLVNKHMETSIPDIYAAGDCAAITNMITGEHSWYPMGTHSNKGGRAAGANAAGGNVTFEGGYGTAIMKIFDYAIARTGMGPKSLERAGIQFKSTLIISGSTPGFFPDQKDLLIEIHYDPETGILLGAELFGEHGVDKRVDVLATALYARLTVDDLPRLDLAYAPPFSAAKDPVVVAGFVAGNSMRASYHEVSVIEAVRALNQSVSPASYTLLDVRNPTEIHKEGYIQHAINIPLDELRGRINEVDLNRPTYVYCAKGLRGYMASLILLHHNCKKVYNVAGGFTAWKTIVGEVKQVEEVSQVS